MSFLTRQFQRGFRDPNSYQGYAPLAPRHVVSGNGTGVGLASQGNPISFKAPLPQQTITPMAPQGSMGMPGMPGVLPVRPTGMTNFNSNSSMTQIPGQSEQMADYADIMSRYRSMSPDSTYTDYNPTLDTYKRGPEQNKSFELMKGLAETGGLSAGEQGSLRERGISPIRSIYANANRNLERGRALQGGYAPGMGAATSRMAREMSDQLGDKTNSVNAGIAEMVQRGKLSAVPQYAQFAADESNAMAKINAANAAAKNQANEFNRTGKMKVDEINNAKNLDRLKGMTSLYGSSPGMAETFGKQALSQAQLKQEMQKLGMDSDLDWAKLQQSGILDMEGLKLNAEDMKQKGGLGLIDAYIRSKKGSRG